ncbi:DUF6339 family protein [Exiguobacterium sp. R-39]|uniref:DUF6339 family protein n=1 Tax=Exiguobacterium sp. R-39 TaxID=3416708 RepID=UPI003CF7C8A5
MNIQYMNSNAVTHLRQNMMGNLKCYQSEESWVESYLKDKLESKTWFQESRIPYVPVKLITSDGSKNEYTHDAENSKRIYESLKSLTPAQATDPRIWTYLTHTVYYEYMKDRWLNKEEIASGTLMRFFATNNRELIRNGIARLWWYGYLTYDESREQPYELTDFLLSNQNIAQGLLERNIGNNKDWLNTILSCFLKYKDDYPEIIKSDNIKKINKYINYFGGVSILDLLSTTETEQFFLDILQRMDLIPTPA